MPRTVLIAFATHEGHTRAIATHIADTLTGLGLEVTVHDVAAGPLDPAPFERIVVASPVHAGHHEPAMVKFVQAHRELLDRKHAALVSIGVGEAMHEHSQNAETRKKGAEGAHAAVEAFFKETGWRAGHVEYVAGALAYSKYNWLIRFIMKRIAKSGELSTDTTKDHDYTNWAALDRFAAELVTEVPTAGPRN